MLYVCLYEKISHEKYSLCKGEFCAMKDKIKSDDVLLVHGCYRFKHRKQNKVSAILPSCPLDEVGSVVLRVAGLADLPIVTDEEGDLVRGNG